MADFTPTLLDKWRMLQAIIADDLPPSAKLAAGKLLEHRNGHNGACYPSIPTLAREIQMSPRATRMGVRALEARWLKVEWRSGETCLFEFNWSRLNKQQANCQQDGDEPTPVENCRGTPVENCRRIPESESKKKSKPLSQSKTSLPSKKEVVLRKEAPPAEEKKPRKPKKLHRPWQPGTDWTSDDGNIVPANLLDRFPLATENMAGFLENALDRDGWMRRKEDRPWPMLLKGIETMLSQMQASAIDKRPPEEIIPLKSWTKLRRGTPELAQMLWKLFEQDMRNYGFEKERFRNGDELPYAGLPLKVRRAIWEEALPYIHPDEGRFRPTQHCDDLKRLSQC
jgi:hypothetical protein